MDEELIEALKAYMDDDMQRAWTLYNNAAQGLGLDGAQADDIDRVNAGVMRRVVGYEAGKENLAGHVDDMLAMVVDECARLRERKDSMPAEKVVKEYATTLYVAAGVYADWFEALDAETDAEGKAAGAAADGADDGAADGAADGLTHERVMQAVHVLTELVDQMQQGFETFPEGDLSKPAQLMAPSVYAVILTIADAADAAAAAGRPTFNEDEISKVAALLDKIGDQKNSPDVFLATTLSKVQNSPERSQRMKARDLAEIRKVSAEELNFPTDTADGALEEVSKDAFKALRSYTRSPLGYIQEYHTVPSVFAYLADLATDPTLQQTDQRDETVLKAYKHLFEFADTARDVIVMKECPGGKVGREQVTRLKSDLMLLGSAVMCATATCAELVDLVPDVESTFNRLVKLAERIMKRAVAPERLTDGTTFEATPDLCYAAGVLRLRFLLILAATGLR
ncbi:hypothetical protein [Bifidobacterium gallicum]|uniref:Uncharacterized protein n=1 Tax=Bifidobacterium gallicum DSM 20093 = LMG 11596 TaxID=561180 RepID=D1NW57_9BIFI|nr:hypothetical protein [Bifidobacterium gallicum]EFA22343.1 hypothetical protein BIFGAL_04104 [Bifidobacterium gallicum DSM 20093 = LMG 11596]KFI60056.1 hypothetical protein BGLCM_0076 [Bifidobacterium gallicum DSM 20093 = LMG 11596]